MPDLEGQAVGVDDIDGNAYLLLMMIAAYVGLDPARDIEWVSSPDRSRRFAEGKIDAFLGHAPESAIMRERKLGHVIINNVVDRPWAHYYCCMLAGNNEFVQRYPVATKRSCARILKAVDFCAFRSRSGRGSWCEGPRQPLRLRSPDFRLQKCLYNKWREYDPEDTIRFYALRLQEAGMIRSGPQKIIADGTDWRFLNELKRELKT